MTPTVSHPRGAFTWRTPGFALVLFAGALAIRLLFRDATPDAAWPYSAYYKGDAPLWLTALRAARDGSVFEWGLPFRPPGMVFLLGRALAWGGGIAGAKTLWCLLGASIPPLGFLALRRAFGFATAAVAGVGLAASTSLLILATSLNNETPYLALVALGFLLWDAGPPVRMRMLLWAALQGAACLVRAEHALFFILALGLLVGIWARCGTGRARVLLGTLACLAAFAAPLLPWEITAWQRIAAFNHHPQTAGEGMDALVEGVQARAGSFTWDPAARQAEAALPAFGRPVWSALVVATVGYRGRTAVHAQDFELLREAFGTGPEPVAGHPFVALYGPLNFYLANNDSAGGGFSRSILEAPPPLAGGASAYPPFFSRDFPPTDKLAVWYPPHLAAVNHGVALGLDWIRSHPARFAALVVEKLRRFWAGAAMGVTGFGFPAGIAGPRYAVDLAVPDGPAAVLWKLAVAAACLAGLVAVRRVPETWLWMAFLASKAAVAALFFGYARIGATAAPVVWLLVAAALVRWGPGPLGRRVGWLRGRAFGAATAALLVLVAVEGIRAAHPPDLYVRDRKVGAVDPYPERLYIDQRLNVR